MYRGGHLSAASARLVFLLTLIHAGAATGAPAAGTTHRVGAGEEITPVLRAVSPGDTIWLEEGEYAENLVIEVPVRLTGDGRPHIRGGFEGVVIHVKAPGTVIEGLRVSEAGTRLIEDMASILIEADSVTVRDNLIERPLHGIYVKGCDGTRIIGNRVAGRLDLIEEDRGNGIHLWNSRDSHVAGNEILNVRDGIYFSFADSAVVVDNHIHHVRYGLHYMYSNDNRFEDNLFEHNVAGAALMYSSHIALHRNTFARCRGFRSYGVLYQSVEETRAEHNLILDNSRGLFLNNSARNVFSGNDVADNDLAIQLNGDGGGNLIAGNNFINNLSELLLDVGQTTIRWADEGGGNYWTGYRGFDLEGDGIGDRPHAIQNVFQVLESDYPEVRFYLFSLAAELLVAAEQALPILELGKSQDPAPRIRPLANDDVPWARAQPAYSRGSATSALIYLLLVGVTLLAFHRATCPASG